MGLTSSQLQFSPVVETEKGPVRGREYHIPDTDKIVDGYLGIPYAEPPIGPLRFKKPQSISPWTATRDCISFGPRCPQTDEYMAQFLSIVGKDEANCLTLNVLTPRWKKDEWSSGYPVMLWVHGGGFSVHSSSNYGDATVARNLCVKDVIFVSINYRLGPFGFFTTGDDVCKGNMGLWDQTMALQWVQDNISHFGGDPSNVTIFGQSAGGSSVDLLSLSPHSNRLFHRVIPMAGCGENDFAIRTRKGQTALAREYARHLGWTGDEDDSEGLLAFMEAQPTYRLEVGITAKKVFQGFRHSQSGNLYFVPNFDEDFFPRAPSQLRKEIPKKSVMTGTTLHEGLFFVALGGFPKTPDGMRRFCRKIFRECDYGEEAEQVQRDIFDYYTRDIDQKDNKKLTARFIEMIGDYAITTGTVNYARQMAEAGHDVYFYCFEYCNPDGFGMFRFILPFRGATHCTELRYLLGKGIISKFRPNDQDRRMIDLMTDYFTNFAKYGNPNGASPSGPWLRHSASSPYRHQRIRLEEQSMADDYQGRRADFWNKNVLPRNISKAML